MSVPSAVARLIPHRSPPTGFVLRTAATCIPRSLPATLSRLANDGVGFGVRRREWLESQSKSCWQVTRVRLKRNGECGRAWGRLWWRGKLVTTGPDEPIPGPVRHLWLPLSLEELHAITNSAPS